MPTMDPTYWAHYKATRTGQERLRDAESYLTVMNAAESVLRRTSDPRAARAAHGTLWNMNDAIREMGAAVDKINDRFVLVPVDAARTGRNAAYWRRLPRRIR
jgi:hypothetical protein